MEVILNAPLKDPIKYRLLDYEISLRRQEAEMIEVVSEQEARTTQSPYHGSITEEITVPFSSKSTVLVPLVPQSTPIT